MGVYIKGMTMPTDEARAFTIVFSDGKAALSVEPFEWHEVIPVPDHGRLGDLDAVEAEIRKKTNEQFCVNIVHAAPTIIPAEEEKS